MRISDAERERVVSWLHAAVTEGRLYAVRGDRPGPVGFAAGPAAPLTQTTCLR
jgi:hypothetical protein